MENSFKLDPIFPHLLYKAGFALTMRFLLFFLADYSRRGLSKSSDRAVAISGLVARIQEVLGCETRYGIFAFFLHRTLLWQRSSLQKMKRIDYRDSKVPSWSWMAYEGGIQFTEVPFGNLDLFNDLEFAPQNKTALITKVWEFQDCYLGEVMPETSCHQILDSRGTERGWIMYDVEDGEDLGGERGVVVARCHKSSSDSQQLDNWEYYILVVRQIAGEYERVGIGRVQRGCISRQEPDVLVF